MAVVNVRDFGVRDFGVTDDFLAFQSALNALDSGVPPPGPFVSGAGTLLIPAGVYTLRQTLFVKNSTIIQGSGSGASILKFVGESTSANTTIAGIVLEHDSSSIRDLSIVTDKTNRLDPPAVEDSEDFEADTEVFDNFANHSGIVLRGRATIEQCFVSNFQHDGIHICKPGAGVNGWLVRDCLIQGNGRHGIFVSGPTNGGCAIQVECALSGKFGFYDQSQAGNTYVACVGQSNGFRDEQSGKLVGADYHMGNGRNLLVGCIEDGDGADVIVYPTTVIGGIINATDIKRGTSLPAILSSAGDFTAPGIRSSGVFQTSSNFALGKGVSMILASSPDADPLELTLPDTTVPDPIHAGQSMGDPNLRGYQVTVKKINSGGGPVVLTALPRTGKIDGLSDFRLLEKNSWVTVLWSDINEPNWYIIGKG